MRIVFIVIESIVDVTAGYSFYLIIDYIYKKRKKQTFNHKQYKLWSYICGLLLILTIFLSAPFQELIRLDNICLKPEGKYCYYVSIYDYSNHTSFKAPAQIIVETNKYLLGDVYIDDDIYFLLNEHELKLNKKVYIPDAIETEDYTYNDWDCTLLNERAYDAKLKIDNGVTPFNITFDSIRILLLLAVVIIYIKEDIKIVNTDDP